MIKRHQFYRCVIPKSNLLFKALQVDSKKNQPHPKPPCQADHQQKKNPPNKTSSPTIIFKPECFGHLGVHSLTKSPPFRGFPHYDLSIANPSHALPTPNIFSKPLRTWQVETVVFLEQWNRWKNIRNKWIESLKLSRDNLQMFVLLMGFLDISIIILYDIGI